MEKILVSAPKVQKSFLSNKMFAYENFKFRHCVKTALVQLFALVVKPSKYRYCNNNNSYIVLHVVLALTRRQ